MISKHTLKWRAIYRDGGAAVVGFNTIASGLLLDDAERIVRAVNAHDELVEALAEMVEAHSMQNVGLGASKRRLAALANARAALAEAEGSK